MMVGITGGTSPRFYTRLPPPIEVGRRPLRGGGGGALEGWFREGAMVGGAVGRVGWGGGSMWGNLGW